MITTEDELDAAELLNQLSRELELNTQAMERLAEKLEALVAKLEKTR